MREKLGTGTTIAAIGAMMAASLGIAQPAQAAGAAAYTHVPCSAAALADAMTSVSSGATLGLTPGRDYVLTAGLPEISQDLPGARGLVGGSPPTDGRGAVDAVRLAEPGRPDHESLR
jgi:hypothetical protein